MPKKAIKQKYRGVRRGNRVIAYIRVSDTRGREETLIAPDVQLNEIKGYCAREGLVIVDTVYDLDKTGTEFDNRQISSIIDRVRDDKVDGVVVWDVSRWGRDAAESLINMRVMEGFGGFLLSANQNLKDSHTPDGGLTLTINFAMAEMFSKNIGKTWKNIHTFRLDNGKPAHGGPRLGYVWDKEKDAYEPDPHVGPWVVAAYEKYVSGTSLRSIVADMNAAGITSTRGRSLSLQSLRHTLDSGFAAGLIVSSLTGEKQFLPGVHQPLISADLWKKYLRRRADRTAPRIKSAPYRVAGLVRCGSCGGGMNVTTHPTQKHRYFRCNRVGTTVCPAPVTTYEHLLEEAVQTWLRAHVEGEEAMRAAVERAERVDRAKVDIKGIDDKIKREEERLVAMALNLADGTISKETAKMAEARIHAKIAELNAAKEQAGVEVEVNSMPATDVFRALLKAWDVLEPAEYNQGLRIVVKHIMVERTPGANKPSRVRVVGRWEPDLQVVRSA